MRLDTNSNQDFQSIKSTICHIKLQNLPSWGGSSKTDNHYSSSSSSSSGGGGGGVNSSGSNSIRQSSSSASHAVEGPRHNSSPFPLAHDVNNRFIIWDGDITTLEADAITNTCCSSQRDDNSPVERIYAAAGNLLKEELSSKSIDWATGEVYVTQGYNLAVKYIFHTVAPAFKEKFQTAAENTLHCSYRNILYRAVELNLRTIAIPNIGATNPLKFPADLAAHIALRTIRRFLERYSNKIVLLCISPNDRGIFEVLAPLYFPRDSLEERSALWQLPKDIGGEYGEPMHPDRHIRIIHNPQHSAMMNHHADDESDKSPHDLEGGNSDLEYELPDLNGLSLNSYGPGFHSYSQMQIDLDRQHLLSDRPRNRVYESVVSDGVEGIEHQERYERLLHRAQIEDLSEVSGIGCLYQSGVDRLGRPVVVFCGKWFPAHNIDLEKALLYLIKLLDPIVKGDYVIAYFHTLTSTNNYPSLHWLRDVYSVLPYKYKKNLKAFYIVHPTFWTKMMTWWFTTFMAPAIKAKVHSLPGVEHLYSAITKDQLEIPAYITEYDMATNGLHYFTPMPTTS